MTSRHDIGRNWRRHPVLTTAALVALAPMMPSTMGGGDLAGPVNDVAGDESSGDAPLAEDQVVEEQSTVDEQPPVDNGGAEADNGVLAATEQEAPATESDGTNPDECSTDVAPETIVDEPLELVVTDEICVTDEQMGDVPTVVAEPTTDETVVAEPTTDETVVDETVVAEPTTDETVVDEPVVDEPVVAEPVAEELAPVDVPVLDPAPADVGAEADRLDPVVSDDAVVVDDAADEADDDETEAPDFGDPGLRAEIYDGVYAQGVPVWVAMSATRQLESGGNYRAEARGSTASGAYQIIDSTWNRYGGYARAVDAPPAVQDQFAYESMTAILKRHGNEVASIPVAWYYPAALRNPALMDIVPVPEAGNVLTPRQYQGRWMAAFHQYLEAGSPVFLPTDTDALIPAIAFPVLGPTWFYDDWHADRDGGLRRHEGLDFLGEDGQPLRAAFDGVITRVRPTNIGRPGVGITITRLDGVRANYFHLDSELKWHPDLEIGDTVKAGQIIGYMGSTGNAGIPHLHFEIRTEEGEPIAPYPAVLEAIQREQCSVGIGPWSTEFSSPATIAEQLAERLAAQAAEALADPADVIEVEPVVHEIEGPDGARWTVVDGRAVTATGVGALIAPDQGECTNVPTDVFGTGAGGLAVDLLPEEWWGDEVDPEELAQMVAAVAAERSHEFERQTLDTDDAVVRMMIAGGGTLSASVLLTKHDAVTLLADDDHGHDHPGREQDTADDAVAAVGPAPL